LTSKSITYKIKQILCRLCAAYVPPQNRHFYEKNFDPFVKISLLYPSPNFWTIPLISVSFHVKP
ncbi:hypothetical protein, partial [Shewanella algae]|uniref:hypothetical protein n=1 Tax=Shewanella algae TaxID=38313 RepID=UPI0034D5B467